MEDPYSVLGVAKSASDSEIKSAFRTLAKKHHPDHNADDPKAQDRFLRISKAYELIGDKSKRRQFDRGEIDAEGKPRHQGFHQSSGGRAGGGQREAHFDFDPFAGKETGFRGGGDIFSSFFRDFNTRSSADPRAKGEGAGSAESVRATLSVSLEEIAAGGNKRVALPDGRIVDVNVPKWIKEGQVVRLAKQGGKDRQGRSQDLLLTVKYLRHPRFAIEGADLRVRVETPLETCVLGGVVRAPTLEGEVEMRVPPHTSGGKSFRLRKKGLQDEGRRGDLIVSLDVSIPENDPELEALMRKRKKE